MNNLTEEQKIDCQDRIDKANFEISEICKKYEVEVIPLSINMGMGDLRYKGK